MPNLVPDGAVAVRNTATGRVEYVPAHFLDNPALLAGRVKVEPTEAPEDGGSVPSEKWKKADLEKYAADHGIDLEPLGSKPTNAEILAAIQAGPTVPDTGVSESSPTTPETPAAGEN